MTRSYLHKVINSPAKVSNMVAFNRVLTLAGNFLASYFCYTDEVLLPWCLSYHCIPKKSRSRSLDGYCFVTKYCVSWQLLYLL